jgi:cation transport ATPase
MRPVDAGGARERVDTLPEEEDFTNVQGLGVQGVVDGHAVLVGRSATDHPVEFEAEPSEGSELDQKR